MARPLIISSPEEFDTRVDEYERRCKKTERQLTLTGMLRALGFSSRQSLVDYAKREGFSDSVEYARLLVEESYEAILAKSVPGAIFALKCNYGWQDKEVIEVESTFMSHEDRLAHLR